jgi:predicted PurR-regulated permease PerM
MKRLCVGAAFLTKLAKHLALLACLMIVSQAAGRPVLGQLGIFITVLLAAFVHSAGRTVPRRLPPCVPLFGGDHDRGAS